MSKWVLVALVWVSAAHAGQLTDKNIENPKFDAKIQPVLNEPALDDKKPTKLWKETLAKLAGACKQGESWTSGSPEKIVAVAMKNMSAPVSGIFERFKVRVDADGKGEGAIDLTSYNSGSRDRDRRVQRYVLDAEKNPVATFQLKFPDGFAFPKTGTASTKVKVELKMGGEGFELEVPLKIERSSDKVAKLVSEGETTFTYATDSSKDRLMKLITLCNHQFLSTFAKFTVDLTLHTGCGH